MCYKKNSLSLTLIIATAIIILAGVYCLALKAFWLPVNGRAAVQPVQQNQAADETASWQTYRNDKYNIDLKYSNIVWAPVNDINVYQLSKEINFERLLALAEKSPDNGRQCQNSNSGQMVPCDSLEGTESIIFAIADKPINEVKSLIPAYALTDYDGHTGYKTICQPLDLPTYQGEKPTFCAFSGFEWNEETEYYYSLGSNTLVVNWHYYDVDKDVYNLAKKNFLDVMNSLKFIQLTTDETADWKTYINTQYGYQINYPSRWVAGISTILDGNPAVFCPSEFSDNDKAVVCKVKAMGHLDTYAIMLLRRWTINDAPKYLGNRHLWTDPSGKNVIEFQLADTNYKNIFDQMASTFKFNQTTTADTSNWKTYTSQKYGFEIKYPKTCQFRKGTPPEITVAFSCPNANNDNYINIENFDIPAGKTFQDVIIKNTVFDGSGKNPGSLSEFKQVEIGGNNFYKIQTGRFEGTLSYVYYLVKNNTVFAFSFTSQGVDWTNPNLDEEADSTHVILKQMLSTLKFTDLISADTSNWKTYRNNKLGFEIKYPLTIAPEINSQSDSAILRLAVSFGQVSLTVGETVYSLDEVQKFSFSSADFKVEQTSISDEKAIKVTRINSTDYTYYCIKNGFSYSFVIPLIDVDSNKILSTFKFTDSANASTDWKTYHNTEYGFSLVFPDSWKGYMVEKSTWNGWSVESGKIIAQGPEATIKNSTGEKELQPIPIMIFTPDQWKLVESKSLAVSVAPIGPSKIGQNAKYVFALPPHWVGFMDYAGQNDAIKIIKTFKAF